ncbi:response regulator transcription factor [Sporosarcina sp. ACRSM]|uniref:helix-turn-helix transcriptional regulator n=1 Tax=Sporosarcina sp. ACRSM TaxID=2918216 RepID=UPI001EF71533|nr:LuxR C-terminal-related transcriptional regulator [Sporosarcina sp. ACRSM]MCG7333677.1 response regulator transcription factor [Sporosarcina sp. ACRSM]
MNQLSLNEKNYQKILSFMDDIKGDDNNFRKNVLLAFEKWFGFSHANFWLCDQQNNLVDPVTSTTDKTMIKDYLKNYIEMDPLVPYKLNDMILKRRVIGLLDLQSKRDYEKSEYFNSFFKKYGFYHNTGIFLVKDNRIVGLVDFIAPKNEMEVNNYEVMCLEIISRYLAQKLHEYSLLKSKEQDFIEIFLTPRESEVLRYVQKGYSNKQIAGQLFISVNTVKKHVQSLYDKFEVNNRTSLSFKVHSFEN